MRFHNCYKVALTLHGTRLWVKTYYEFLFHLDNGFKNFFELLANVDNLGDFIFKIPTSGMTGKPGRTGSPPSTSLRRQGGWREPPWFCGSGTL